MRTLLVIGIGAGNPEHLTVQAINALNRADVLFQAMDFGCARDRYDPRLLRQQPGQCYLRWSRLLLGGNAFEQVDQGLVCLQGLRGKAWQDRAKVSAVEGGRRRQ